MPRKIIQSMFYCYVDYVGCPYCNRRFNEKAAQRHISFCKEQHERLPTKKTIDNTTATRANARTNVGH